MAPCLSCGRPVALSRESCLYCGAALPRGPGPGPAASAPPEAAAAPGRVLIVLDLEGSTPETLARALEAPLYEASLLARRGGLHLHRVLDPAPAEAEAGRLAAAGARCVLVPEAEARARPVRALGGEPSGDGLALRTEDGPLAVRPGDVLLVVRGAITRQYRPAPRRRRVDTAGLDEGYRVHLHLRPDRGGGTRPVEIDPAHFEFGFAVTGSARLEADAWVESVAGSAPRDDGFRRLPPALGPEEEPPRGALAAAGSLPVASRARRGTRDEGPVVLDNVEQFRFYSGWRAAVERRRLGGLARRSC
jgi:hypothetical protein